MFLLRWKRWHKISILIVSCIKTTENEVLVTSSTNGFLEFIPDSISVDEAWNATMQPTTLSNMARHFFHVFMLNGANLLRWCKYLSNVQLFDVYLCEHLCAEGYFASLSPSLSLAPSLPPVSPLTWPLDRCGHERLRAVLSINSSP